MGVKEKNELNSKSKKYAMIVNVLVLPKEDFTACSCWTSKISYNDVGLIFTQKEKKKTS